MVFLDFSSKLAESSIVNNREAIKNQENVSLVLSKQLLSTKIKESDDSNIIFSPLSISVMLGLIAAGSGGSTRNEVLRFLNSDNVNDFNTFFSEIVTCIFADAHGAGGPSLAVANGVWIEQTETLKKSFKDVVENVYDSVHFRQKATEVVNEVNSFAKKQTNGRIQNMLSPASLDDDETRLILVNALYFKGNWFQVFEPHLTRPDKFHLLNGTSVEVPFMSNHESQCADAFKDFKILKLNYKQGRDTRLFSMYILLPNANDGLQSLTDKVCSEPGFLKSRSPKEAVSLNKFRIPKFRISFEFEASGLLKELGVVSPFHPGRALTETVESLEGVYVSKILHKSFVEVNEEGTEAAAATEMDDDMGFNLFDPPKRRITEFVADHPFLVLIQEDRSGVALFVGAVLNPLSD